MAAWRRRIEEKGGKARPFELSRPESQPRGRHQLCGGRGAFEEPKEPGKADSGSGLLLKERDKREDKRNRFTFMDKPSQTSRLLGNMLEGGNSEKEKNLLSH